MNQLEESMRRGLGGALERVSVRALVQVDSTNLRLKEEARAGRIRPPFLLMADSQTAGRGRLGRRFVSPPETGLYMSLFISPPPETESGKITILSAVAVCRAIEEATGLRPKIKWVNDLFVKGKKVCGILAERIDQGVIVGIGVNLLTPPGGFPPEAGAAGALDKQVDRGLLAGLIARYLLEGLEKIGDPSILDAYRAHMPLVGRQVRYVRDGQEKTALVTGVAQDGGLMIEDENGPSVLRTGEVTLGSEQFAQGWRREEAQNE